MQVHVVASAECFLASLSSSPHCAEGFSTEPLLLAPGRPAASAQALASHLLHGADATWTELSMGGLN